MLLGWISRQFLYNDLYDGYTYSVRPETIQVGVASVVMLMLAGIVLLSLKMVVVILVVVPSSYSAMRMETVAVVTALSSISWVYSSSCGSSSKLHGSQSEEMFVAVGRRVMVEFVGLVAFESTVGVMETVEDDELEGVMVSEKPLELEGTVRLSELDKVTEPSELVELEESVELDKLDVSVALEELDVADIVEKDEMVVELVESEEVDVRIEVVGTTTLGIMAISSESTTTGGSEESSVVEAV